MKKENRFGLLILSTLFVSIVGCDKGEIPVAPREPGDVLTAQVEMGSDYGKVLYYSLKTNSVVHQHLKTDWDLGFETGEDGWHVILNSGKAMSASTTDAVWLKDVLNVDNAVWINDAPSGNMDSTAIGDWKTNAGMFLLDRGYDINGSEIGVMKLRIEETVSGYRIHFADVASTDSSYLEIEKDDAVNFVCASLEGSGSVADIEPNKEVWHIKFTQYTHIFVDDGEVIPYSVTGALLNPHHMKGMLQTEVLFDSVDHDFASLVMYSDAVNAIGYDWKYYDFDLGSYTVFPEMVYLLRSSEGVYWKLHFIDFYTQNGEKGAPMFEFQEL
jgi:hypothetical protein